MSAAVRDDLYDVIGSYLEKGDSFWLAIDDQNHVVGCIGYSRIPDTNEAFLHRFYVASGRKRQAIAFQRTGTYISRQKDLLEYVSKEESIIVQTFVSLKQGKPVQFNEMSEALFQWVQKLISGI